MADEEYLVAYDDDEEEVHVPTAKDSKKYVLLLFFLCALYLGVASPPFWEMLHHYEGAQN